MDNAFRYLETVTGDETEMMYPYRAEVNAFIYAYNSLLFAK